MQSRDNVANDNQKSISEPIKLRHINEKLRWIDAMLADDRLTSMDKLVGYRLAMHFNMSTGQCNPREDTLAAAVGGFNIRTIKRAIASLKKADYISSRRTTSSAVYTLHGLRHDAVGDKATASEGTKTSPQSGQECHLTGDKDVTSQVPRMSPVLEEETERETESECNACEAPAITHTNSNWPENAFNRFWYHYPNKVDQKGARAAFERIEKSGVVDFEEIMRGVEHYEKYAKADDTARLMNPANWLDKERWPDRPKIQKSKRAAV